MIVAELQNRITDINTTFPPPDNNGNPDIALM